MHKRKELTIEWYAAASTLTADWDAHLPSGHFLRIDSLGTHEASRLPHIRTIYALIRFKETVVGQAAFQLLHLQPEHISASSLKPWQSRLWRLFAKGARPKLLVAGQLFRHDVVTYHWNEAAAPFDVFQWYQVTLGEAVRKFCAHAVLVKEPPPALVPYFQHYAPEYLLLRNDSSMQLALPPEWTTFSDYEKSLKHKYAQRLRKVRQSWQGLRVTELSADAVEAAADTIYGLYLQVTNNQAVRMGILSRDFLPQLKRFYGARLRVWGIYEGETMIAFASAWVQDCSFDMFYIGLDYERNRELQLYFNILFFSIEQAITLRKPQLILGRTALEAKARVGCRPEYLHTFLYIKNPVVRAAISRLQQKFAETSGEWENRHPFKAAPERDK